MKKINITVSYNEEYAKAIRVFLNKKDTTLEKEVCKILDSIYIKTVPSNVRDYISMCNDETENTMKGKK